jgi:hypothetical protein
MSFPYDQNRLPQIDDAFSERLENLNISAVEPTYIFEAAHVVEKTSFCSEKVDKKTCA